MNNTTHTLVKTHSILSCNATRTMRWLAVLLCSAIGLHAEPVQLDLSGGFNADAWCGAAEFQFLQTQAAQLSSLQGKEPAAAYYLAEQYASGQMVGCSSTQRYAIPANWFYDRAWAWVVGHEGTPENGVVTGAYDRVYHIASHAGNATLPGDWLSSANLSLPANWPTEKVAVKSNCLAVAAPHSKTSWQLASTTASLPVAQQRKYVDINFVVAAWSSDQGSRNARIKAVYSDASTQTIYATPTQSPPSGFRWGPCLEDDRADTNAVSFAAVWTMTRWYNDGESGVGDKNLTLFEFAEPITLQSNKVLTAITVEDADPSLDWTARGFSVFAATATAVPLPPPATMIVVR